MKVLRKDPEPSLLRVGFCTMPELAIVLGYRCNFKCKHCMVGEKKGSQLSQYEKKHIVASAKKYKTKHILFIGGEPTLYIREMNDIISRLKDTDIKFRITTNGHFAWSKRNALKVLSSVDRISGINLSYDRLHAKFLPDQNIKNLFDACEELKINFSVIMAMMSPMDLVMLKKLREIGHFTVMPQKLLPIGSAKLNNIGYKYPSFDESVLAKSCPNKSVIIYMCGQGFTSCCSSLALCAKPGRVIHKTVIKHMQSEFYKLISKSSFRSIMKKLSVSDLKMSPEDSAPCILCEHIFRRRYGAEL